MKNLKQEMKRQQEKTELRIFTLNNRDLNPNSIRRYNRNLRIKEK